MIVVVMIMSVIMVVVMSVIVIMIMSVIVVMIMSVIVIVPVVVIRWPMCVAGISWCRRYYARFRRLREGRFGSAVDVF